MSLTITLKGLKPEDFHKVGDAVSEFQKARETYEAAERRLKELGIVLSSNKAAKTASPTGKRRGRKPKNPVV